MNPQLLALIDRYRDVPPTNVIIFEGLDEARAMQRDPAYRPTPLTDHQRRKIQPGHGGPVAQEISPAIHRLILASGETTMELARRLDIKASRVTEIRRKAD